MNFFTQKNPPPKAGLSFDDEESAVQPQFKDSCDINQMIARLARGDLSVLKSTGVYYDITNIPTDLQSSLNLQIQVRDFWNADENDALRKRFVVPENLIDFLSDSKNREEAIQLGILPAPVADAPVEVKVVNPTTTPSNNPVTA